MGVPRMPASRAEHRITRDPGRGTLAPDLFRDRNGNARGTVCQGHVLASLDATFASVGNGHRQEQAFWCSRYTRTLTGDEFCLDAGDRRWPASGK